MFIFETFLLSSPIVVTASNTNAGRVVVMGELCDENGKIVVVALELNPTSRSGKTTYTDVVKIVTTQGRSHIQSLLKKVLYIDSNKKRVKQWLNANRLQLPLRSSTANSINIIAQNTKTGNTKKSLDVDSEGTKQVLVDGWLGGGTLWNEESKFIEVLDKVGIKNVDNIGHYHYHVIDKINVEQVNGSSGKNADLTPSVTSSTTINIAQNSGNGNTKFTFTKQK